MDIARKISLKVLRDHFPSTAVYREPRRAQEDMLGFFAENGSVLIEAPTGSGKSAVEYAIAMAFREEFEGTAFIITPNKTILEQIKNEFPDLAVALGRNEHACLYYHDNKTELNNESVEKFRAERLEPRADEIPCIFLQDCPHRVNQETGRTVSEESGGPKIYPCPYYQQKFEAKQERVVLATMSFYLFTHLFGKEFDTRCVVIDEVHRIAEVVRNALSYDITDHHLERSEEILKDISPDTAETLKRFRRSMCSIAKKKSFGEATLLEPDEIRRLIDILQDVDLKVLSAAIKDALKTGKINPREDRVTLKKLEMLVRDLRRYISSLEYSVPTEERKALNYTCAFHRLEKGDNDRVENKLVVKCYYVAPLIRKMLPKTRASLSATIGDPEILGFETGIKDTFLSLSSNFPSENTRIYLPVAGWKAGGTPNLAVKNRSDRDLPKSLRLIARSAKRFADKGIRSLVAVISNDERERFMRMAEEEKLKAVSYGNGVTAKEVAVAFRDGNGDCLVGTAANYGEGIDLPKQIAPVIFFLRPGYPNPNDPGTQFEESRWGGARWAIWDWRVMQQALQIRGRNIRSRSDVGVTFFISQQFRRVLFAALPKWLEPAYKGNLTFEEAMKDAEKLLS